MVSLVYWMMWLLIVTCVGFGIWGLVRHHGPLLIIGAVCGLAFATNTFIGPYVVPLPLAELVMGLVFWLHPRVLVIWILVALALAAFIADIGPYLIW